jgi:hypothetical protein
MSNENQIIIQAQKFMNYWFPEIPRCLPEKAQTDYNMLRDLINAHLAAPPKPVVKKKTRKKASKKK